VKICFTEFVEVNPRHHFSCNDDLLTDFANFLSPGTANRTVASTQMNATSSRAHTVVTITFDQIQKNEAGQETKKSSSINLVDLAGNNSSCVSCTSNQFLYRLCLRWPSFDSMFDWSKRMFVFSSVGLHACSSCNFISPNSKLNIFFKAL